MAEVPGSLLKSAPATAGESVTYASGVLDQRRPGRLEKVSPALIPLLREPAECADGLDFDSDPLAPARGIVVGLLLSVPLWGLIGLGVWFVL
jgi:hypothetical protein